MRISLNVHSLELFPEFVSIDPIAIAKKILRGSVKREGLDDLLCGPCRGRMGGDVEMKNAPPVMGKDNENISTWNEIVDTVKKSTETSCDT